jgi:hypothetical protein
MKENGIFHSADKHHIGPGSPIDQLPKSPGVVTWTRRRPHCNQSPKRADDIRQWGAWRLVGSIDHLTSERVQLQVHVLLSPSLNELESFLLQHSQFHLDKQLPNCKSIPIAHRCPTLPPNGHPTNTPPPRLSTQTTKQTSTNFQPTDTSSPSST